VTPSLALSPTVLSQDVRDHLARSIGEPLDFLDLATLRRDGILPALRRLRATRRPAVVITVGEESDRWLLGDTLSLASLLVPAGRRLTLARAGALTPLNRRALPQLGARMAAGSAGGLSALAANSMIARSILGRPHVRRPLAPGAARCLYLKPNLQFGLQVGGSIAHVAGVVNALTDHGVAVEMLVNGRQPMVRESTPQRILPPRFRAAYPSELNSHRYHRQFHREATAMAAARRPEFIYQRYVLNDLTGARLRESLGVPLILEFNGSEVWVQRNWGRPLVFEPASDLIERANLHAADLVVVVSAEVGRQAEGLGVPEEKILVYPNCVDAEVFDPARITVEACQALRAMLGIPPAALLYTFVGTFGRWHGADVLAKAIRELAGSGAPWLDDRSAHFLFVGDGLTAPAVREILAHPTCAPRVTLAGLRPQTETPITLAASDVLVSPHAPNADGSAFFGSPTKLFEYMAMARPIVASDLDQIGQVLRGWTPGERARSTSDPAVTGLLVRPGDAVDLARGLAGAAALSPEERAAMGRRARSLVESAFSWSANVAAVLERAGAATPTAAGLS